MHIKRCLNWRIINQSLYLELWDEESPDSWAVAFFDEIVTLYDKIPNYKTMYDVVKDSDSMNRTEYDLKGQEIIKRIPGLIFYFYR